MCGPVAAPFVRHSELGGGVGEGLLHDRGVGGGDRGSGVSDRCGVPGGVAEDFIHVVVGVVVGVDRAVDVGAVLGAVGTEHSRCGVDSVDRVPGGGWVGAAGRDGLGVLVECARE